MVLHKQLGSSGSTSQAAEEFSPENTNDVSSSNSSCSSVDFSSSILTCDFSPIATPLVADTSSPGITWSSPLHFRRSTASATHRLGHSLYLSPIAPLPPILAAEDWLTSSTNSVVGSPCTPVHVGPFAFTESNFIPAKLHQSTTTATTSTNTSSGDKSTRTSSNKVLKALKEVILKKRKPTGAPRGSSGGSSSYVTTSAVLSVTAVGVASPTVRKTLAQLTVERQSPKALKEKADSTYLQHVIASERRRCECLYSMGAFDVDDSWEDSEWSVGNGSGSGGNISSEAAAAVAAAKSSFLPSLIINRRREV